MLHIRKRCPHCGHVYKDTIGKDAVFGSPVQVCANCTGTYIDKDVKEPFFGAPPQRLNAGQMFWVCMWPFGWGALVSLFFLLVLKSKILLIPLAICLVLYLLMVSRGNRQREALYELTRQQYRESEERLKDKAYVMLLMDNGCEVPAIFLANCYPELSYYVSKGRTLPSCVEQSYMT